MDNLIIEVGKYYKTRCGYKVQIYAISPEREWYKNIHGAFLNDYGYISQSWYPKGNFLMREEYGLDIVGEWVEPHPAESWEVDKKILVSSNGIDWFKRHFAKYENGQFYVWNIGGTSWTAQDNNCFEWKFAKPAEENE